jgi:molybdate-binding protein
VERIKLRLLTSDYCYAWHQELADCGTTVESIAEELDLDFISARLTVGFYKKDRHKSSGLEGLSSKDVKKQLKKDLKKNKALN